MTEPQPVMAQAEQDQLTRQVGRALLTVAGEGWQRVRAEYRSAGRHVEADVFVTGPDGTERPVRPPQEVVEGFGRLRQGMYRPGRGTWLAALYLLEPPSAFSAEFEPDTEPRWRRVPPPIGFQDELRFFPRADEHIPDWWRQRAGLPPLQEPTDQPPAQDGPAPGAQSGTGNPPQGGNPPGAPGNRGQQAGPTPTGNPGQTPPTPPPGIPATLFGSDTPPGNNPTPPPGIPTPAPPTPPRGIPATPLGGDNPAQPGAPASEPGAPPGTPATPHGSTPPNAPQPGAPNQVPPGTTGQPGPTNGAPGWNPTGEASAFPGAPTPPPGIPTTPHGGDTPNALRPGVPGQNPMPGATNGAAGQNPASRPGFPTSPGAHFGGDNSRQPRIPTPPPGIPATPYGGNTPNQSPPGGFPGAPTPPPGFPATPYGGDSTPGQPGAFSGAPTQNPGPATPGAGHQPGAFNNPTPGSENPQAPQHRPSGLAGAFGPRQPQNADQNDWFQQP